MCLGLNPWSPRQNILFREQSVGGLGSAAFTQQQAVFLHHGRERMCLQEDKNAALLQGPIMMYCHMGRKFSK